MPDAIITSTASTFGTISGTFSADQSTIVGTVAGSVVGNLSGSVGVPGPAGAAGPGVPAGGTAGQYLQKIDGVDYNTDWVTLNLSAYAPLNSPAFTGDPTAPTAPLGDNDTSLATTAFVQQELLSGTANAKNLEVYVRNQTGSTLAAGAIVYINGATGNRPTVTLAQANNDANSAQTMGFVKTAIANNGFGYVIVRGEVENLDTSALTEGVQLYLSPTTAGAWTTTKPSAPQHLVYVGIVIRSHPTQGVILVAVQNGYELNELHDVAISSPTNGQVLKYNSSTGLWYNGTDSSGVAWGSITGTLSSQTDLQTALDGKYSTSNPAGYITSSALSPYLTSATAASTYQTISGMSSYLTTSAAASTYYPLTNPSGYITSSALAGYATESWVTSQGYITSSALTGYATESWVSSQGYITSVNFFPLSQDLGFDTSSAEGRLLVDGVYDPTASGSTSSRINIGSTTPSAPLNGDFWSNGSKFRYTLGGTTYDIASESYVTTRGYITSSALSPYLLSSTAASTYQTIAGMSSYLTTASAASTYQTISGMSSYLTTSSAASTYQTISGMSSYLTTATAASTYAPLASPALTGNPTAPTPATADNDTSIATTAFVKAQGYLTSAPVTSVAGKTGAVTLVVADVSGSAPLASPALTGTPTAPTASPGTNTTQIATTAFVQGSIPAFAAVTDVINNPLSATLSVNPWTLLNGLCNPNVRNISTINASAISGSAAVGGVNMTNAGIREMYTNATASAGRASYFYGVSDVSPGYTNSNWRIINWSKKVIMSGRCMMGSTDYSTNYNGDANTRCRIMLGGKTVYNTGGDLNARGICIFKLGGNSTFVQLQVHNGTTLTTVASSFQPASGEAFSWTLYSDGSGNVTLYINGSSVATSSAGPTGNSSVYQTVYVEQVEATASAAVKQIFYCFGSYIYIET